MRSYYLCKIGVIFTEVKPRKDKNTQKTNINQNMSLVSCDQYSKGCVQCTKMIIKDYEL